MVKKRGIEKKLFCSQTIKILNNSYTHDIGVMTKLFSSGFFREIKGGYKI